MIEIYLLEQLKAFADCGTLSSAAEKLHISQPSLSRSMKKIEEIIGVPLFEREKNRISLNRTGELAAEYAAKIIAEEIEIENIKRGRINIPFSDDEAEVCFYLICRKDKEKKLKRLF